MYKIGINFDEISDNLESAIELMRECGIKYGELRTINQKNFVFWSDEEVSSFKQRVDKAGIELVAAATPLFKWYENPDDSEVRHDSFGFNPRIDAKEKQRIIERTFQIASKLEIPCLRIFSGLGKSSNAGAVFARDPLLNHALDLADKYEVDLCIENEPICRVHTQAQVTELLANQKNGHLKLWLDIANFIELGEEIEESFVSQVADRLSYIHAKDFIIRNGKRLYVPIGEGQIDYRTILAMIDNAFKGGDLVITAETHAKKNKVEASTKSLSALKAIVAELDPT